MKLTLDHTQRLNLHALLGAQRGDVATIRAIWAIQDRIALSAEEEKSIELKRGGQERAVWNPHLSLSPKVFDLSDPETSRIRSALEVWDSYSVGGDRRWLQPLIEVLFSQEPR